MHLAQCRGRAGRQVSLSECVDGWMDGGGAVGQGAVGNDVHYDMVQRLCVFEDTTLHYLLTKSKPSDGNTTLSPIIRVSIQD